MLRTVLEIEIATFGIECQGVPSHVCLRIAHVDCMWQHHHFIGGELGYFKRCDERGEGEGAETTRTLYCQGAVPTIKSFACAIDAANRSTYAHVSRGTE